VTEEILEQRAQMERAAGTDEGQTLCDQLATTVQRFGGEPAYSDRQGDGPWQTISWAQARQLALELAAGFIEFGLQPGDAGEIQFAVQSKTYRAVVIPPSERQVTRPM